MKQISNYYYQLYVNVKEFYLISTYIYIYVTLYMIPNAGRKGLTIIFIARLGIIQA